MQDEQLAVLRSLDSTVQRLADVPWGSARIHLEEAKLPGRSAEQVRRSLELASERLHDAISAASANSTSKADARLMLAIVSAVLRDEAASRYHAEHAYDEARVAARWLTKPPTTGGRRTFHKHWETGGKVAIWYAETEWSAAFLGDPEAPGVRFVNYNNSTTNGPIPHEAILRRSPDRNSPVRWRSGARLDFVYIAYSQALSKHDLYDLEQWLIEPRFDLIPLAALDSTEAKWRYLSQKLMPRPQQG